MKKILPLLVLVMLLVSSSTIYFAYGAYKDYKTNDTLEHIDTGSILKEDGSISNEIGELENREAETEDITEGTYSTSIPTITMPTDQEVYNYAQKLFDVYTNYGDNYVPEVHDDLVMRETAEHFEISVSEANSLYYKAALDY